MSKKMLINASHPEENRVAIVVDGVLSELDIELAGQEQSRGNIYKAAVVRVETGLQAAFVDYGADKLGFLQISEIHPEIYPARHQTNGRPRIADILHRGQEILVQVVKEERGHKGAALTTFLSLPGRYMVLMPDSTTKGVSRKITEEAQRKVLKKTMAELHLPDQMGYIVRTAGIGKEKEELKRDFDYLVRLYEGIIQRKEQVKAPAQLYQESNLAIRSIRDYFSTDMDEVLVDDEKVFNDTKDFFALVMPEHSHLVKRHRERRPIFSRYQIEEQIDALSRNQVALPSGGSIVIDPTEALVAIDVNSGKMSSESGIEATAAKTNLEAATEVGRQLRLRDLGGLIVIDFIDMRDRKHIREIEQELRKALKNDKARVSVGRISQFGLMEMSRQRIKPVLSVGAYQECPHCHGLGRIKSIEAQAVSFLRQAHTAAAKGQIGHIEARVPYEVANYLLNQKRNTITQLEILLGLKVTILGQSDLLPGELHLESFKREKDTSDDTKSVPVSHANQIEMALAEAQLEDQQPDSVTATDPDSPPDGHISTPEAVAEADSAVSSDEAETPAPAKKRRRRRRKKPAAQPTTTSYEEAAAENLSASEETTPRGDQQPTDISGQETSDSQSARPLTDAPETSETASPTQEKPRRRSRRPRKTAAKNTQGDESHAQDQESDVPAADINGALQPAAAMTTDSTSGAEGAADTGVKPARPARKRPTNKSRSASTATAEAPPEIPAADQQPPVDDAPLPSEKLPEGPLPVKKPGRKPRQPGTKSSTAKSATPTIPENATQEAPDAPADKPAPKRPRRTRKTSPPAAAEDNTSVADESNKKEVAGETAEKKVAATDNSADPGQAPPTETIAARTPQRRRRSKPTKAAATAEPTDLTPPES
ncbi:Rne/Rng family ribonuclease [Pelovirga terrestris]|uniref:Ribonuclease G n=1 Tax=Pelovirga terrestris TaxID=2771352 RepID=A0A8J6QZI1_9BACT|nr:Rne/Rng family ribonuclease [Pelovirga terrestris]MBD1401352.1 Rne/Rng family ribonuclease [Pelovirga terrestris]